jgi:hypothetical protein
VQPKPSYAAPPKAIAQASLLVVDKPIQEVPQMVLVDMGCNAPVKIELLPSENKRRSNTLYYSKSLDVVVMLVSGTLFNLGPPVLVAGASGGSHALHSRVCTNKPCKYAECVFYHDPLTTKEGGNAIRKLPIDYAVSMLRSLMADADVGTSAKLREPVFLRDSIMIAGAVLFRVMQIIQLHYGGKRFD